MPIAKFEMPDGRIARFEVPDGTTPEQAQAMIQPYAQSLVSQSQQKPAEQSGLSAQLSRMGEAADQAAGEHGRLIDGLGEAAANMATGIGSSIVGGWRGLAKLATGGSLEDAAKASQETQEKYTYQPRTGTGKLAAEALALPLTAAKEVTAKAGEGYGMLYDVARNGGIDGLDLENGKGAIAGRAIGDIVPDVAMTLMGGASALKAARNFKGRSPVREQTPVEPQVDYDVPAYVRNGVKPAPEQPPVPTIPEASPPAAIKSALDRYAEKEAASPFPQIAPNERISVPEVAGKVDQSPLDRYVAANPEMKVPLLPDDAAVGSAIPSVPAHVEPPKTWTQFLSERMGDYMKSEGGHAEAMKRISSEWNDYKSKIGSASNEGVSAQVSRAVSTDVSPLDRYIADTNKPLFTGEIPSAGPAELSPLDRLISSGGATADTSPARFDQFIRDTAVPSGTPKSPLDAYLSGAPLPSSAKPSPAAIAGATDDIKAVMQQIGGEQAPKVPTPPAPPARPVPPAGTPTAKQIPSPIKPKSTPAIPADSVERTPVTEIAERTLPADEMAKRAEILQRVGMKSARQGALEGNALKAATEYGIGKFDEPAGHASQAQFSHEISALEDHIKRNIKGTKGIQGLDEASLESKGQAIAAPYDAARKYFEDAKKNLYDEANRRAGSIPITETKAMDALLKDPEFSNTAMADDQLGLVNAIQKQFDLYKERNGGGLTVENAEQFRKWLNKRWKPENREIISSVKNALDDDVFANAGEDIYSAARSMHTLEKATLDNNKIIAKLMDSDPYDPVHRTTSYDKIADAVMKLSPAEFKSILQTYKEFPEELQASVQRAISTIKAHYGDRFIKAGTSTRGGNERPVWGATEVNNLMDANSSKLPMLFETPEEIAAINDLRDAGNIISTNPAYPGAAAQMAMAKKQGLGTKVLGKSGAALGGAIGSVFGPAGAGTGALIGEATTANLSNHLGQRKALAEFKKGIIDLSNSKKK